MQATRHAVLTAQPGEVVSLVSENPPTLPPRLDELALSASFFASMRIELPTGGDVVPDSRIQLANTIFK
jgi:hypothetical protein